MIPADNPPICVVDGEITVDAGFLAPKLGLSVEALRAEMRLGRVVSTCEKGRDEDAGRFRVTFRHGARVWRAVVEADGRHIEVPADPTDSGTLSLADLVRRATWD